MSAGYDDGHRDFPSPVTAEITFCTDLKLGRPVLHDIEGKVELKGRSTEDWEIARVFLWCMTGKPTSDPDAWRYEPLWDCGLDVALGNAIKATLNADRGFVSRAVAALIAANEGADQAALAHRAEVRREAAARLG